MDIPADGDSRLRGNDQIGLGTTAGMGIISHITGNPSSLCRGSVPDMGALDKWTPGTRPGESILAAAIPARRCAAPVVPPPRPIPATISRYIFTNGPNLAEMWGFRVAFTPDMV